MPRFEIVMLGANGLETLGYVSDDYEVRNDLIPLLPTKKPGRIARLISRLRGRA